MIFNRMIGGGGKATITYSGTHTTESYTLSGQAYTQYKITGSGTLAVDGKAKGVKVWLCGGGANGISGGSGGGGAYCAQYDTQELSGNYAVSVASAGGASSITKDGTAVCTANGASGKNGGTGGGGSGSGSRYVGKGDSVTKYPFGDSVTFQCHCAGGGGGGANYSGTVTDFNTGDTYDVSSYDSGGAGGSNGGSGSQGSSTGGKGGAGGTYGGGAGGSGSSRYAANGGNATFYGSGGGGYGYYDFTNAYGATSGSAGSGYQGVVYIRVPV